MSYFIEVFLTAGASHAVAKSMLLSFEGLRVLFFIIKPRWCLLCLVDVTSVELKKYSVAFWMTTKN